MKGFAPAKPGLDAIAAAKTTNDIAKLMARPDLPLSSPLSMGVTVASKIAIAMEMIQTHRGIKSIDAANRFFSLSNTISCLMKSMRKHRSRNRIIYIYMISIYNVKIFFFNFIN